ncbi:GH36-type glycosyl hydrolase domain-containing protein [Caulobacter sp. KR2-114]|uniref:GH36-type glycosyl hydrolase domain-containing protein n=1 Tax=Caulobacter sp. KR2-114 TaxID=3400912 RepID=UPI003BFEEB28
MREQPRFAPGLLAQDGQRFRWDSQPIRSELFGVERLEEHARALAAAQTTAPGHGRGHDELARRLASNEAALIGAFRDTATAVEEGSAITPAAEWLIDNFHVVEEQIRDVRAHLPPGYYRQLPKLAGGPFAGLPRVFGLSWAFVAHNDSLFDPGVLCRYVHAYQEVQPLTIGELWAIAISLRLVLVENLRRLADRVLASRTAREQANALADRLLGAGGQAPEPPQVALAPLQQADFPDAFFVQLVQRLRDQDPGLAPALAWVEARLAARGASAEAVVAEEHLRQMSGSITVRNIITSMRLISNVDWTELVERVSLVDAVLAAGSRLAEMDFPTRNLYRSAIEALSRGSDLSEIEVARAALTAARTAGALATDSVQARLSDPGYYLIAAGRPAFEAAIGYRSPWRDRPGRLYRGLGISGYVGAGAVVASLILAAPLLLLAGLGVHGVWLAALGVLGVAPAIDLAVAVVNQMVTRGFRATLLPALGLEEGIPDRLRTLVAIPTLLTSRPAIDTLIERLEIHYLSSPKGALHFALVTDWADADAETADGDQTLLEAARAGVADLNRRHGPMPGADRFLLLHRRRLWNPGEGRWIGWERKRGKLSELNRLLRGASDTSFIDPPSVPADVRYVITLDSDTRLPRETVTRLIGKMAHPLNRPRLDPQRGRVVEGYALLQPRVTPSLPVGREGSLFLRIFSSASGIDPYAAAVSDVYQDLFGEGSYTGKGIYDVDAFEAALAGRTPERTLLSHDLFEGVFARAGLASDTEVVEDFPARYDVAALRHHRWARGDWQLLPWIVGRGPPGCDPAAYAGVPAIGRWKMLDNLRRSLSAPSNVLALLAACAAPSPAPAVWTGFILLTMALPPLLPVAAAVARRRPGVPLLAHLRAIGGDVRLAGVQLSLMLVFLGHQAWLMGDAILRTLWRLTVTHRHLLEWTPTAQAAFGPRPTLGAFYRRMSGGVAAGAAAAGVAWWSGGAAWLIAGPLAAAWIASPAVALWASRSEPSRDRRPLTSEEQAAFRRIARRTWRFFETFVTGRSHHLPPDNFQETPEPVVARRTSPTNIGLYLLSVICAQDLGWIGLGEAVARLEATLATMGRLARSHGHFYNWYDTEDLRPLEPGYVSSVDSGNLAGHLIALAGACRAWTSDRPDPATRRAGLLDVLGLAREALEALPGVGAGWSPARRRVAAELEAFARRLDLDRQTWDTEAMVPEPLPGPLPDPLPDPLDDILERLSDAAHAVAIEEGEPDGSDLLFWVEAARRCLESHRRDGEAPAGAPLAERLALLEASARSMALAMDFAFLLDPDRLLLSIGFQASEGLLDENCYDLLASEARLASFIAIAKGDAPARHWFRLGRAVTPIGDGAALISWSGSMFEYLMPALVMRTPSGALLEQTGRLVVRRQIEYGRAQHRPWGISESAFNARDLEFTYQYSNFGVPGLGLKRGLADNLVIAPYATALAAMVDPRAAARNFQRLAELGASGRHGFYEAIDFTPPRVPEGEQGAIVRTFMAHHQGMSIVALADTLLDGRMRERFHADPMVQATDLLLQERVPRDVVEVPPLVAESATAIRARTAEGGGWREADPWSATPDTHMLSNGRYAVMLTAAGSGFSTWRDFAVTRWREDPTCDDWGSYIFLRDVQSDEVWSAGLQPTPASAGDYQVVFNEEKAEFARRDGTITTTLEVVVSAEDDAEVRRLTITNQGPTVREIEVTSYAELVLAPAAADRSHPAFSKLFVETEHLPATGTLLAHRRRRAPEEPEIWAAHLAVVEGEVIIKREFETDRARFIGRGRGIHAPIAVVSGRPLSGTTGTVLDPVFVLRRRVQVAPGRSARIDFWTMAAASRGEILGLVDKHHDKGAFERAAALAWTQAQVQLHHLGIDRGQAGQFQRLAARLIYASPTLRPPSDVVRAGAGGQPDLWSVGISGDLPIILVRIDDAHQAPLAREALDAVEYLRAKRLAVDLVILNERGASYVHDLQVELEAVVRANQSRPQMAQDRAAGHIYILRADLISDGLRALLASTARVVLVGERGRLSDQIAHAPQLRALFRPSTRRPPPPSDLQIAHPPPEVEYFNGLGGFADDGREYVVVTAPGQSTPAPWGNVIANAEFGFQVTAEGGGHTWSGNAKERQLTPWSNDPVSEVAGQVIYVRDQASGELWTATAQPVRDEAATYLARHGFGYSRFEHAARGLALDLLEYVPLDLPVRISRLTIRNTATRARRLSVTGYVEWVLGPSREAAAPFVSTRIDDRTGAMLAQNAWYPGFAERVAFLDMAGLQQSWTADRREFIGRNGVLDDPAALADGAPLSRRTGAGLDPCGALQRVFDLAPGASIEVVLLLGDAADEADARRIVGTLRAADLDGLLEDVRAHWTRTLGALQVRTPDRSMDIMLNGWLLYQTLACRIWARTGFYQASGAYGFRDQIQDVMALAASRPEIMREHLIRAAGRQFPEGDVQHWWLPHTGQGVRTRISDDRLWLPLGVCHYLEATGDESLLEATAPFIGGPVLAADHAEAFFQPDTTLEVADVYEHCARAIEVSLALGAHGLPLIGGGDWNDGMNRVGLAGRGESVWLGWFQIVVLSQFAAVAERRGDARAAAWRAHVDALRRSLEHEAWDGEWYRRGWYDDGAPLGSVASDECRIDSIAQSWAVLSGAADPARARAAMASLERDLILPQENLALLFTPPFDRSDHDPGYIKGYPPGVRENGGQYTHAALWTVLAFAELGEGDKAAALFWILNPINHARTRTDVHRYKVEPYVVAADVYAAPQHLGRGGWTWYTGSAGWMQRAGVEGILGLRVTAGGLSIQPRIPHAWPGFSATLRHGGDVYEITVDNPAGDGGAVATLTLDGRPLDPAGKVPLVGDGETHRVHVTLGPGAEGAHAPG